MLINPNLATVTLLRKAIRDHIRCDETLCVNALIQAAELNEAGKQAVYDEAYRLTEKVRTISVGKTGIQSLLNEYSLSSDEGVLLMCLAEALLRIPDTNTADKLIQDKLLAGDWQAHVDADNSLFLNASAWGLVLTGSLVDAVDARQALPRLMGKLSEPVIRRAMRLAMKLMGNQFVLGRDIDEALKRGKEQEARGFAYSFDMLGEGARTMADAKRYFLAYKTAIEKIGQANKGKSLIDSAGISVKLSAIHPRYEFAQRDRVLAELIPQLKELILLAKQYDIGFTVDAEESYRLDLSLDIIEQVFCDADLGDWSGFGFAIQAYQRRGLAVSQWAVDLCRQVGRKMMLRLVKGAYWDSEIKLAQVEGQRDYPVFTRKASTDISYQACARHLLANRDVVYPQFATHNAYSVCAILSLAGNTQDYEFQLLHGMGEELYDELRKQHKVKARIYAPVGKHEDLLAYLVRRLLENGANTSFVNNIIDTNTPIADLIANPVNKTKALRQIPNARIPAPKYLYGDARLNSSGVDISDINTLVEIGRSLEDWIKNNTVKLIESDGQLVSRCPFDRSIKLGAVPRTNDFEQLLCRSNNAFGDWSARSANDRASCLEHFADLLQSHEQELFAICMFEAGKTLNDAIAEVREAIDFCRYYAAEARKIEQQNTDTDKLIPRGVVLCISPWNFPLAIFLGQVTAALSVGNTVLAKPAEQTALIAQRALELLQQSGVGEHTLQLVIASGDDTSKHLLSDPRIRAVMFTGSTKTGQTIAQTLATRAAGSIPLVAETGGQNCMMVDSSALLEQVVDDVIISGFQSAGQRCSALRVLYVQEEIADKLIEMIKGAMQELVIGNPTRLSTDIGPVIDDKALRSLNTHAERMQTLQKQAKAMLIHQCELNTECDKGTFFAPRLYEIDDICLLPDEVFGPCVHIIRYASNQFETTIKQINSTGFGLTAGIHSRIDSQCRRFATLVDAGNIYVNRNIIGAIVGVQPFGGHGLSGTGPKAGGPLYQYRLLKPASSTAHKQIDTIQAAGIEPDRYQALKQQLALLKNKLTESQPELICQQLDGPTGERNEYRLHPRGVLLAINDGNTALNTLLEQARKADNQILEIHTTQADNAFCLNAPQLLGLLQHGDFDIDGVLLPESSPLHSSVAQALSRRPGKLLALIDDTDNRLLQSRLRIEKVISTDTTASGGNAALLAGAG